MTTNGAAEQSPTVVRRLESGSATSLVHLVEMFEDLQMVLRCCEQLVTALGEDPPDEVRVEALWTTALLSYARCFWAGPAGAPGSGHADALGAEDLRTAQPTGEVLEWHRVLLQLREHYLDATTNPRERFSVGVAQDRNGAADGVAVTSVRQPLVDELTVRQTGAIAYALSGLLDARIAECQGRVLEEVRALPPDELDRLVQLQVAAEPTATT